MQRALTEDMEVIRQHVAGALDYVKAHFPDDTQVSLVIAQPHAADAVMFMSDTTPENAIEALNMVIRLQGSDQVIEGSGTRNGLDSVKDSVG